MLNDRKARFAVLGTTVLFLIYLFCSPSRIPELLHGASYHPFVPATDGELPLPEVYQSYTSNPEEPGVCANRYGSQYIRNFSRTATSMCESNTAGSLTCFAHQSWDNADDQFCFGTHAIIDPKERLMSIDCSLRSFTKEELVGHALPIDKMQASWYGTGPRYIYEKYIQNTQGANHSETPLDPSERVALLVQREGGNVIANVWHVLMQMMSLWLSIDILRVTIDPVTGGPFYTDEDVKNTQVVILDEEGGGPFYELWDMFGGLPTVRLKYADALASSKILLPISGGTNPIWQSRGELLPCQDSILLRGFVHRILDFYKIPIVAPERPQVTLTFADRNTYRDLVDKDELLDALRERLADKYPHVKLEVVDFADYELRKQIEKIRATDILLGVHGAALTHALFLPEGGTVVEIQPPKLKYFGFESLARFLGHGYFQEYGNEEEYEGMTHNWQADDIFITEEKFLRVVERAINVREWREDLWERRLGYGKVS